MPRMKAGRSKYGAVKTTVDGITFDSKKEAARYRELALLVRARKIHAFQLQPEIVLHAGTAAIGKYRGDFFYCECDTPDLCTYEKRVIEDVKGFKTPLYRWKKKHVKAQYGIEIREV